MTDPALQTGSPTPLVRGAGRTAVLALLVALAAMALALCVFAPRFGLWAGLFIPTMQSYPEVNRACAALFQVQAPFEKVTDASNQVIFWRMLFPVLWHYLRLPLLEYLAVPFVGCVLTLWMTAWWTYVRLKSWWSAWLVAVLFAALPWFFVSTGWLAYFDSWLVLGLLLAALSPRWWVLALACLLTPWVDERFILALPVTFAFRAVALGWLPVIPWVRVRREALLAAAGVAPYLLIRLIAVGYADKQTVGYIQQYWSEAQQVAWMQYLLGWWSGYRLAWAGLMVVAIVGWKLGGRLWGTLLVLVGLGTAVMGLFIAADLSRDMMMLAPGVVLAAWLAYQYRPRWARWALPLVVAGNLLLPAEHVMWSFANGINSLPREIARFRLINYGRLDGTDPRDIPMYVDQLLRFGAFDDAMRALTVALQKAPDLDEAYFLRAQTWLCLNKPDLALSDIQKAVELEPGNPEYVMARGAVYFKLGDWEQARVNAARALELAPKNWTWRPSCESLLAKSLAAATQPAAQPGPRPAATTATTPDEPSATVPATVPAHVP